MNIALDSIIETAKTRLKENDGDYWKDGLLYCGKCNTPKSHYEPRICPMILGALCECEKAKADAEKKERLAKEKAERVEKLKSRCFSSPSMCRMTFANDSGICSKISYAVAYAEKWNEAYSNNLGLLFCGKTGTGKTYAAACIANDLTDNEIPVRFTDIPTILNGLFGSDENRADMLENICYSPSLLVIDDFGMERQTEYAKEQISTIINLRYSARKPLIITTNIPFEDFNRPSNIFEDRIYSRIMEMCQPILFDGDNLRNDIGKNKRISMRSIFQNNQKGDGAQ